MLYAIGEAWVLTREELLKLFKTPIGQLSNETLKKISRSDLEHLTDDERCRLIEKIDAWDALSYGTLSESIGVTAEMEGFLHQLDAKLQPTDGMTMWSAMQELRQLTETLKAGVSTNVAAAAKPDEYPEAEHPWTTFIDGFFASNPSYAKKTVISYRQAFADLEELIKDIPAGQLRGTHVVRFAEFLQNKPIDRAGKNRLSHATIVKSLNHIKNFISWLFSNRKVAEFKIHDIKARGKTKEEQDGDDDRLPFSNADLKKLFDSPIYTGSQSVHRRNKPGRFFVRDEKFWFLLLMHLTGARPEELACAPSHLFDFEGVPCLDLRKSGTKTQAAPRLIPVLPELCRLGFVEWANHKEKSGELLFKAAGAPTDWSKWTNRYLDKIGLDNELSPTYSLRHNFRQMMNASGLNPETMNKIFGHKTKDTGGGYGRPLSLEEAKRFVQLVKSPIALEHLFVLK